MGKAKRQPHLGSHALDDEMAAEVVIYLDNFGKTRTASLGGNHYAAVFVARRSKWTWVELLQKERQMPEVVDRWLVKYHRLCGHLPTVLFSDGAPVNASAEMGAVLDKRLVSRRFTVPHNSEQNPAEVYIRLLSTIARTNMQASGRPLCLWGEAFMAASYIRNRLPCSANPGSVSPYEMEFGVKPNLSHMRVWGATCYSALPHDARQNVRGESLDAAADVGVYVGCQSNGRGC